MTYSLKFLPSALEEWEKVNNSIKPLFKKKLQERLNNPHVPASRLRGFENHYKIKLFGTTTYHKYSFFPDLTDWLITYHTLAGVQGEPCTLAGVQGEPCTKKRRGY